MRGKVTSAFFVESRTGITPAYAGKRRQGLEFRTFWRDHPRTCGEKLGRPLRPLVPLGSPPHMRGKVGQGLRLAALPRITPAHAGKRHLLRGLLSLVGDHPRTCGEKPTSWAGDGIPLGSPPHMRGKANMTYYQGGTIGITPAHAGKSCIPKALRAIFWDHPRTCGEKAAIFRAVCVPKGSPPHMRGKVAGPLLFGLGCGITPAHAGKSCLTDRKQKAVEDHPRTCGEKGTFSQRLAS